MAGGAFAMTLVALVVPGIPTVPCLLATSYYLSRSSPRLNERLRHAPFFGPILQEWEHEGALSRFSKEKLTGLTLVIAGATFMFVVLSPITLVLIVVISSLSIYGIARMPDLAEARMARQGSTEWRSARPGPLRNVSGAGSGFSSMDRPAAIRYKPRSRCMLKMKKRIPWKKTRRR